MKNHEHWKDFFGKDYIPFSETILTSERTEFEVKQLLKILDLPKGSKILDLGCGQGRVSIPLAKAGYKVTSYDGSQALLDEAKYRATLDNVDIQFVHGDMRQLDYDTEFDAIINLGTAFGYVPEETDDQNILNRVYKALKPNGLFLQETENREMKLQNTMGKTWSEMNGQPVWSDRSFNCETGRWKETICWWGENKIEKKVLDIRLYSTTELKRMLTETNFNVLKVYGGFDLSELTVSSKRLLLVNQKKSGTSSENS